MKQRLDIDQLLDVFCEGIYSMDPKTTQPFWDYDFAPVFGDLWIKKMRTAITRSQELGLTAPQLSAMFPNIAVPRKEMIYSLVDLKVGNVDTTERLRYLDFWWKVVLQQAQRDPLAEHSNIVHTDTEVDGLVGSLPWNAADATSARLVGNLTMNLNSLAYQLYTDVFAHNAMENFGAYDVSRHFGGKKHILVIKQWVNLRPSELYPDAQLPPFDRINIYAIYKDVDFKVDIYTHQVYSGNAAENLVRYAVTVDGKRTVNDPAGIEALYTQIGPIVIDLHARSVSRGFEDAKKAWVLARNYQFKDLFRTVGMEWRDQEMLDRIKDKPLVKTPYWTFNGFSKDALFAFWKRCFDPRLDTYYDQWGKIYNELVTRS